MRPASRLIEMLASQVIRSGKRELRAPANTSVEGRMRQVRNAQPRGAKTPAAVRKRKRRAQRAARKRNR
jgi:hypothetical protein